MILLFLLMSAILLLAFAVKGPVTVSVRQNARCRLPLFLDIVQDHDAKS